MKIVITGGAGYIGSQLAFLLVDRGYNVLIIDNFLSSKRYFCQKCRGSEFEYWIR